jgi:hypothetical protein
LTSGSCCIFKVCNWSAAQRSYLTKSLYAAGRDALLDGNTGNPPPPIS